MHNKKLTHLNMILGAYPSFFFSIFFLIFISLLLSNGVLSVFLKILYTFFFVIQIKNLFETIKKNSVCFKKNHSYI